MVFSCNLGIICIELNRWNFMMKYTITFKYSMHFLSFILSKTLIHTHIHTQRTEYRTKRYIRALKAHCINTGVRNQIRLLH